MKELSIEEIKKEREELERFIARMNSSEMKERQEKLRKSIEQCIKEIVEICEYL